VIAALISRSPFLEEPGVGDVCDRKSKSHTHKWQRKIMKGVFALSLPVSTIRSFRISNAPTIRLPGGLRG